MCTCNRKKDVLAVVMKVRKHVFFFFLIVTTAVTATYLKPADGDIKIFSFETSSRLETESEGEYFVRNFGGVCH